MSSVLSRSTIIQTRTTHEIDEDRASTIRQSSPNFDDENVDDVHEGDYSSRMEELLNDESDIQENESEGEEDFVYTGIDADEVSGNYREQLRDVLGGEHDEDETSENEVENSLLHDELATRVSEENALYSEDMSDCSPSTTSVALSLPTTPPRTGSPSINGNSAKRARPFLHPTISRLRSSMPHSFHTPSISSIGTFHSHIFDGVSPAPSQFSSISRTSSLSNLRAGGRSSSSNGQTHPDRDVFRWTELRTINHDIYVKKASKLFSVLGAPSSGNPTVFAANGLICVGTDNGKIYVYDFKQTLKCVCGNDTSAKTVGSVSALALSHDHTYIASGHIFGHIQLFDLDNPQVPARFVSPTTLVSVLSGRKEGHLHGSRILSVGFVAGRHTAIVSADEHGLAFYHSLGKVLFVEASDILRIFGKYPKEEIHPLSRSTSASSQTIPGGLSSTGPLRGRRSRYTVLAMMPLPLGTFPHPTDGYNLIALLTPAKLVVVGLKPTPKTWFKRTRDGIRENSFGFSSKSKGTLAWFPSIPTNTNGKAELNKTKDKSNAAGNSSLTNPTLVYSWGNTLHLMRVSETRVKQTARNSRTGKIVEIEVGNVVFEEAGKWSSEDTALAVQWLNVNQVVILTSTTLEIYDVQISKVVERVQFDGLSLVSPSLDSTPDSAIRSSDSIGNLSHSMRVYKGKIFLLGHEGLQVGTLLTWADRILSFVEDGDFLSAIDMARTYFLGEAPGNTNGLPDDPQRRQEVVGERMRGLMVSSTRYAFSNDRMTDGTHVTPDGRGVDRTSLFEGLVTSCARACIALDDYEFLFEDLFQQYDDTGILHIFLMQLQTFILDNSIRYVPPRITQRLVALHEEDGRPDLAERLIWHIDPACLDINQAIRLCQTQQLYDALLYVYTRALKDYVSPVVELLGLIRKVHQYRKSKNVSKDGIANEENAEDIEPIILNAYKIYPYLANVLSGLTYPSEEPLEEAESLQAKKDVYTFLFFGRSSVWPIGDGGRLVLTADEEGGVEPTYPYVRLLLRFDAESFLHSLDIAFEDAYLNDESQGVSRPVIVKILMEILLSRGLPASDVTFVNIFIARNVPKYPQFIQIAPSSLHGILIGLADDPDESTREDRQLAAEYLLSVYNPHESDRILRLFETARFFRILRSWHRQERRWAPLLETYLHDNNLRSVEVFSNIDEVLDASKRANKGSLPPQLLAVFTAALPRLLQTSVTSTAFLVDEHFPDLHEKALDALGPNADRTRFVYLRYLLGPRRPEDDEHVTPFRRSRTFVNVPKQLQHLYISLQCQYHPSDVIDLLKHLPMDRLDWSQVLQTCEANEVYDAVVWASNWRGSPREALSKASVFEKRLTVRIIDIISVPEKAVTLRAVTTIDKEIAALESLGRTAITICLEHSKGSSVTEAPSEDLWFQLLSSQINSVQSISGYCSAEALSGSSSCVFDDETVQIEWRTLSALRSLVQETFSSLVSISSTRAVSFPRMFKRLVDPANHASASTPYKEFRTILTGMLESYRSEGDMLGITKHLINRDLFETIEDNTRERSRGWAPLRGTCSFCREPLLLRTQKSESTSESAAESAKNIHLIISRTGTIYHSRCSPPEV